MIGEFADLISSLDLCVTWVIFFQSIFVLTHPLIDFSLCEFITHERNVNLKIDSLHLLFD